MHPRELRGDGPTPIALALLTAGQHIAELVREDEHRACRQTYILLVTDGEETCNGPGAGTEVARSLLAMVTDGVPTPVRTFVIGFGEDTAGSPAMRAIAAAGGTGEALTVEDEVELGAALQQVIVRAIANAECGGG